VEAEEVVGHGGSSRVTSGLPPFGAAELLGHEDPTFTFGSTLVLCSVVMGSMQFEGTAVQSRNLDN
jgi:hypothetical protein